MWTLFFQVIKSDPDQSALSVSNLDYSKSHLSNQTIEVTRNSSNNHAYQAYLDTDKSSHTLNHDNLSIEHSILKPYDSSSSFTSSDGETKRSETRKMRNSKNNDDSVPMKITSTNSTNIMNINFSNSTPSNTQSSLKSKSKMPRISSEQSALKFGEFHAFNGLTTAVTDMVVCKSKQTLFVGGQNGYIMEHDLMVMK